uniref:uncharacterized protein LOC117161825 n=1 Tax=Bombus vancouverensis nearcticus TaxID=2705178 RepID=UPI00143C1925|nr:uncharacterized protein LOC117161825 [Bombus vancouverensis nearcticus]
MEETTEEEETPAVEAPCAKKRKARGSSELPTHLVEEMRTSTTADIGAKLIRRASEVTKVAGTSRNLKGTHLMEERLQNVERRKEKEIVLAETTRRVEPGVLNTSATKGGQAAAMKSRYKEETTGEANSRDRGDEPEERPRGRIGERNDHARITKDRSGQSYAEVLATDKDSVPLAEVGINALAVVAEPYRFLDVPDWTGDTDKMIAVTWTSTPGALERSNGYVAVEWAGMVVVGVYVSPNSGWAAFEEFLDGVRGCVRRRPPQQVLVLGDFNAHSTEWGNPRTNARGRALSDWAAGLGLLLVNRGSASTCVA